MILLYIYFKNFFLNFTGLSNGKVASPTKKEYGSVVHFLWILMKSLASVSDKWLNATCWSSPLLGIFIKEMWVETSFGTLKCDCIIKTI